MRAGFIEATNRTDEMIRGAMLQAQIQFECPMRTYTDREKEKRARLMAEAGANAAVR